MRKIQLAIMAAALVIAVQANASLYNISYTETDGNGSYAASGWLDVTAGLATTGSLAVTGGAKAGIYSLLAPAGSDSSFVWDNVVIYPGTPGFLTSTAGLAWKNATDEVNMWYNASAQYGAPDNSYSFWGVPPNWTMQTWGTATLTPVPEPTTMIAGALLLLPFGASTLRVLRRRTA
jgi:hypothetical protein